MSEISSEPDTHEEGGNPFGWRADRSSTLGDSIRVVIFADALSVGGRALPSKSRMLLRLRFFLNVAEPRTKRDSALTSSARPLEVTVELRTQRLNHPAGCRHNGLR
jgi:hypothetical protein